MKEKYYVVSKTITKWKLDNPFENWLGYRADTSEFWKRLYVLYYKLVDYKYYNRGIQYVDEEINKQRANLNAKIDGHFLSDDYLRRDMIYSLHRFGVNFFEYFVYKFYNKNSIGREKINNLRIQYGYCELVNDPTIRDVFDDKERTFECLKLFYKRDLIGVSSLDDYQKILDFVDKHGSFIFKPLKGVHGMGIKIYRNFDGDVLSFLKKSLQNGPFVIEELIEQAPEMSILHKESINTIRIATFKIKNEVIIYGAAMRMGTGNAFVDNAGSGGIFCHVNHLYGFVDSNAKDYLGNEYVIHPDTKVRFIGFDIPNWSELVALVKAVALVIEGATVISWDFAFSKKGWVLLEANDVGGPDLIQNYEEGNKYVLHSLIDKYFKLKDNN